MRAVPPPDPAAAGTVVHRGRLPPRPRSPAARLVATHKNGTSARQPWPQPGPGGHKPAWLPPASRARRWSTRTGSRWPAWSRWTRPASPFAAGASGSDPGRSHDGKLEIEGEGPGRTRPAVIGGYPAVALGALVAGNVTEGGAVVGDGWSGCAEPGDVGHGPRAVGDAPAHAVPPWIHRVLANARRWALGVRHGPREEHLRAHPDELVLRLDRRRTPQAAFSRLLGLHLLRNAGQQPRGHARTMLTPVVG